MRRRDFSIRLTKLTLMPKRLGVMLCILAAACSTDDPTGPKAARIVLNFESLTLQQLDSAQLIPSFVDSHGTLIAGVPTSFSSSDPNIVSISNTGVVRSLGPAGSATITVRGANISKTVPVAVQGVASKLVVTPNPGVVPQKGTLQLTARLLDRVDAPIPDAAFTFESSNPNIATVAASGLVTSVGPSGSISITVRSGQFATTAQVAVTQVATKLQVLASSPIRLGANRSLKPAVLVLDAVDVAIPGQVLRFTSLNPALITVSSDGIISSVGPLGTTGIRIDVLGTTLSATLQVQIVIATSPSGTSVDSATFGGAYAIALTANGGAIVTGPFRDATAVIDLQTRSIRGLFSGKSAYGVAISKDQRRAYLTTTGGALREIDLVADTYRDLSLAGVQVFGLALSPDDRYAYVGTNGGRLVVVDLASWAVVANITVPVGGLHVTVHPSGRFGYVSWDSDVAEVDLQTRQFVRTFTVPRGHATALSTDGSTMYVGTENGAVYRVDLATGESALFKATPDCGSWGLGVTPDDQYLYLACSGQGRVDVLEIASRQVVRQYSGYVEPRRVAVSVDGATVVVATGNGLVIFR
ncbi:MAG TPA: Ig-like domain-containing protein [Gemmatimonadaceae bacterium]